MGRDSHRDIRWENITAYSRLYTEVGSNKLHLLYYMDLSNFLNKLYFGVVLMLHTFYSYLSRYLEKKYLFKYYLMH